jgi:hypothetical protein
VVAAQQGDVVGQSIFGPVTEGVGGAALDDALVEQVGEVAVPGDLAKADDDADLWKCSDLRREMGGTIADLLRRGLVAGRGAADDRANRG